ncbi:translation factor GTPase family protein [Thomasclavelia sp.]|uniref:translation factor GTPase family protein n=1 Tax=Thomasclavelia sp. TaxID=3025757 RepID=UPI0025D05E90|nr:TetM/TetW/TetO/TetS family tetracycline resistance ribosomal protection protein [Thomasclavelia sp.]
MKNIVLGILAHVDAGKTTLTESMLYLSKTIRQLGRVDHGDAYLDYNEQERDRGITIFSKEAIFNYNDVQITLIDTPGHIDFSTEMERALQVLDYAILVINGTDGIQSHSETIWQLLKHYQVPTFIFVNKMDIALKDKESLMNEIKSRLSEQCYDFDNQDDDFFENIALNNESLLDYYLNHQTISKQLLADEIANRQLFPVYFGSALKLSGIDHFLLEFTNYITFKQYPKQFGGRVYKISHDKQGNRLTHLKITGGSLQVKETILPDEKIDQIRIYSGTKYQLVNQIEAGSICSVTGLKKVQAGQGLGFENDLTKPVLGSYLDYQIILPEDCNKHKMLENLSLLSQEDPQLHIVYEPNSQEIHIQLMGAIQIEVLKKLIYDRFNTKVEFAFGKILYQETILEPVEGVGHYEPLRHYSEVHLLLEPGPAGSGLQFAIDCKEDQLAINYQRLVLTHLQEKQHLGVLTGSPITDMKITLIAGKAHLKHTEGGDFREATYRAVRQGLKMTKSVLLEPYFNYRLEIPASCLSRAIYDLETMDGTYKIIEQTDETTMLEGQAPVRKMQEYQNEVISYSQGKGRIFYQLAGYFPCKNQDEIVALSNYDSEADLENPTGSVFCKHGAGFNVRYDEVANYMHLPYRQKMKTTILDKSNKSNNTIIDEDEELEAIFRQTYGQSKRYNGNEKKEKPLVTPASFNYKPECILVDGYNVIHSWPELKELAKDNLDSARMRLIDLMCNYQGYKKCILILVFDAYKVKNNLGTTEKYHNIYLVYTKEAQTADMYIERTTHELASKYNITVVTSDALEQLIVLGHGGKRISSRELYLEATKLDQEKLEEYRRKQRSGGNNLLADIKKFNSK